MIVMVMALFNGSASDSPIRIAQEALAAGQLNPGNGLVDSINRIITEGLWQQATPNSSFGHFAIAPVSKGGLGLHSAPGAKLLKFALMQGGHIREWTAVLLVIMRSPGRPEIRNNDEGFRPFYTVNRSINSQDRALISLFHKDPEKLEDVFQWKYSIADAAIKAGLKTSPSHRRFLDLEVLVGMNADAQVELISGLFNALGLEIQAAFIAQAFEGVLGSSLAQKWRDARSGDSSA